MFKNRLMNVDNFKKRDYKIFKKKPIFANKK